MAVVGLTRVKQILRIRQLSNSSFSFLTENSVKNASYPLSFHMPCTKYYCTDKKTVIPQKSAAPHATEETKKRKGMTSPQITLIDTEDVVKTMSLENADKLAKRRNLKLVKIIDFDSKTERPVYKIMTTTQFFEETAKSKERKRKEKQSAFKDPKMFTISSKIGDNDLAVKVKQMSKALIKKHPVRVFISQDGNPSRTEELAKIIEEELQEFYSTKENSTKLTTLKLFLTPKTEDETVDANKKETEKVEEPNKVKVKAEE